MFFPRFLPRLLATTTALLALATAPTNAADSPASVFERGGYDRSSFNEGWRFKKDDPDGTGEKLAWDKLQPWLLPSANAFLAKPVKRPDGTAPGEDVAYTLPTFDDSGWRALDLPHDWGVESPFKQEYPGDTGKLPYWGVAWYRKTFDLPAAAAGKRITLEIDGAMSYPAVWCNGQFVGGWSYGYSSFQLDLTPYLKAGQKNTLAIRLDNPDRSSRWYPGGGIYRNVWLTKTGAVHVAQWGVAITTPKVSKEEATIEIKTEVTNDGTDAAEVELKTAIKRHLVSEFDFSRLHIEFVTEKDIGAVTLAAGETRIFSQTITVKNPALWSTTTPQNRYFAITSVGAVVNGKKLLIDERQTPFGIRSAKFTADNGFLLNGERVQLQGVCNHHDLGALGTAINTRALERQILLLKEMGCNAIRTSHNPPAPELLELADKHGILVLDEFTDMWKRAKAQRGYSRVFNDWSEADLRSLIKRDRNHPSVIAWSTGNEVGEQGGGFGNKVSQRLTDIAHAADPSRPVTTGNNHSAAATNGFQQTLDIFGYNYKPTLYHFFRTKNPDIPVYGSETASTVSSRGEYFFPVSAPADIEKQKGHGRSDYQVSSYDLSAPGWAFPPDVEFKGLDKAPHAAGEFVWTGFDYLGEPTPYGTDASTLLNFHNKEDRDRAAAELKLNGKLRVPSRSSYFGIIDLAGFPKDRFYIYQARWRPDYRMAHILPHWNWPERVGQVTPVHVYSSGDEAELFLNGESQGRKKRGEFEYRFRWDGVKYAAGELKVITWKNGKEWAGAVVKTTGAAAKLVATPDSTGIAADGTDLVFVTVRIADAGGLTVPRSKNLLRFSVVGAGEIVATDNGDATDHTAFSSHERKAFNGLALVILRAKRGASGTITLKAESDGLESAVAEIKIK